MPSAQAFLASLLARLRGDDGRRAGSAALALAIEALVVLAMLSLGRAVTAPEKHTPSLVSIALNASDDAKKKQAEAHHHRAAARSAPPAHVSQPKPQPPAPVPTPPPPPAFIPVTPRQMAGFDISRLPRTPSPTQGKVAMMGPSDNQAEPDSTVVGTAPGGEPLYAASWYREPYPDELRGYLSTATGPGWGLIACKTAPEYRVVDCVPLDEYPQGSRIANAVLAAAWQFKVRPPRVGGVPQIGDWVRIRIDYGIKYRKGG